jgi:hypothetical protein
LAIRPEWVSFFELTETLNKALPKIIYTNESYTNNLADFVFENNSESYTTTKGFEYYIFFYEMHKNLIEKILKHIEEYSSNDNKELNTQLINLTNTLLEKTVTRIYSTNYDCIFSELSFKEKFYNGFDILFSEDKHILDFGNHKIDDKRFAMNLNTILNETDRDVFYNLHGCKNFVGFDSSYPNKSFSNVTYSPNNPKTFNTNRQDTSTLIKKKLILDTRIISGQQKKINTSIELYNSFFNVFQRDCFQSDSIIVIGQSLNDEHIRMHIINTLLQHELGNNKSLKLFIITYSAVTDSPKHIDCVSNILRTDIDFQSSIDIEFEKCGEEYWFESKAVRINFKEMSTINVFVYHGNFEEFLRNEENWKYFQ